jgi:hypothetical protein
VTRLQRKLQVIAGKEFLLDDGVEDATFWGDLDVVRVKSGERGSTVIETAWGVRFSNFGSLITTMSNCPTERLSDRVIAELLQALSYAGFHHVPFEVLGEPSSGRNSYFVGSTWWYRFFDYT